MLLVLFQLQRPCPAPLGVSTRGGLVFWRLFGLPAVSLCVLLPFGLLPLALVAPFSLNSLLSVAPLAPQSDSAELVPAAVPPRLVEAAAGLY